MSDKLSESDPQHEGRAPESVKALVPAAERTSRIVNEFIRIVAGILKVEPAANYFLMRGFSMIPRIAAMSECYGLKAACVAVYPMYRGLAQLVGMDILETGETWSQNLRRFRNTWASMISSSSI